MRKALGALLALTLLPLAAAVAAPAGKVAILCSSNPAWR